MDYMQQPNPGYAGMVQPPAGEQIWLLWRELAQMRARVEALEAEVTHLRDGTTP